MADIDRIIQVLITRQTSVPSIQSFDTILIAATFADTVFGAGVKTRSYSSLASVDIDFDANAADGVYNCAAEIFAQNPSVTTIKVGQKDSTDNWTVALGEINTYDAEWYGLIALDRALANQKLISDWVESNNKLCVMASDDVNIANVAYVTAAETDIASYVKTKNYTRTAVIYSTKAAADFTLTTTEYIDAAWMGRVFTEDPGSANWAYQQLSSVSADTLTDTQKTNIEKPKTGSTGKNANYYISTSNISHTRFGTTGNGDGIDITRGTDWLKARIQQLVFTQLINNRKVPYTNNGIDLIKNAIKQALSEGVNRDFINDDYTVSAPLAQNVSVTDKANRLLPNVTFSATLTGAINWVEIAGTVAA